MVIRILGERACGGADAESDFYIPLKVSWRPRSQAQPLYLMVAGGRGGDVELKVDPENGALVQVVVIGDIPSPLHAIQETSSKVGASLDSAPILDLEMWGLTEDGPPPKSWQSASIVIEHLALLRLGDTAVLYFSNEAVTHELRCGDVRVGVSEARTLVRIEARLGERSLLPGEVAVP